MDFFKDRVGLRDLFLRSTLPDLAKLVIHLVELVADRAYAGQLAVFVPTLADQATAHFFCAQRGVGPSGPLAGVELTLIDGEGTVWKTSTDDQGQAELVAPPGSHTLEARLPGFLSLLYEECSLYPINAER